MLALFVVNFKKGVCWWNRLVLLLISFVLASFQLVLCKLVCSRYNYTFSGGVGMSCIYTLKSVELGTELCVTLLGSFFVVDNWI